MTKKIIKLGVVLGLLFVIVLSPQSVLAGRRHRRNRTHFRAPRYHQTSYQVDYIQPQDLQQKYKEGKIRILLVPGHDNRSVGTSWGSLTENQNTLLTAKYLKEYLEQNPKFEVSITRNLDTGEYVPEFQQYFTEEKGAINAFIRERHNFMQQKLAQGDIKDSSNFEFNAASPAGVFKLYGINKWANEHNIDLAIHLHFNDYAGRFSDHNFDRTKGGFIIFTPDSQFAPAPAGQAVAEKISQSLQTEFSPDFLTGKATMEAQDLIALGSNASQTHAALLIEQGYIYEPRFSEIGQRDKNMRLLTKLIYQGLLDFFQDDQSTLSIPSQVDSNFKFTTDLHIEDNKPIDITALQQRLKKEHLLLIRDECESESIFGVCTLLGVMRYQNKYHLIEPVDKSNPNWGSAYVGPNTRVHLNNHRR